MKIRIVKASKPTYWYADKIGEVFEVVSEGVNCNTNEPYYVIFDEDREDRMHVYKEDCEEVIEHNSQLYRKVDRPVREGDTVLITDAYMPYGMYKNGDVIRCDRVKNYGRGIYSKQASNPDGNASGLVTSKEFVVIEPIEPPIQPSVPTYAEVSELLHEASRQTRIDNAFEKVVERNGAALKRLADSDDIVEHNGKQYRKVKRKAAVGELVHVFGHIEKNANGIYEVECVVKYAGVDDCIKYGGGWGTPYYDGKAYETLELVEQSGQSELDLIANLAQEVAELKRQLTDAKTDIADLEDRVDENEKDTEELIGRMNDLGDGAKAGAVKKNVRVDINSIEIRSGSDLPSSGVYVDAEAKIGDLKFEGTIEIPASMYTNQLGTLEKRLEEALRND